jgi:cell division protein FtsW (lipid II flippase)
VDLRLSGEVSAHTISIVAIFCVLTLTGHVIIRRRFKYSDPLIFPIVVALNGIGFAEIHRIDYANHRVFLDEYIPALKVQLIWGVAGFVIMLTMICVFRDHRLIRKFTWTSMFIGIVLVILPLIPAVGVETNGAKVWVSLGPLGSFQPAEFAKIFLAIFFAGYLTQNSERLKAAGKRILGLQLPRIQDLGPILLVWFLSLAVLVLQHDLGTSLLFFGMFVAGLYISTAKVSWAFIGMVLFSLGAFAAFKIFPHVATRVDVWLNPFDPNIYYRDFGGSGQVVQGFFALSNGGLFGTGFGNGYPRLTPFSNSDFIYTALGEELGLTGLFAILMLYLLLIQRGMSTALKARDGFGKLIASLLSFSIALQIFVVVGGITRIIPLTGLTLPFIARGGSSLIANWIVCGLLILVSNEARKPSQYERFKVSDSDILPLLKSGVSA